MSNNPIISIIVPLYNAAPFLRNTIDSILEQTFSDFELIIVDDGSTDGSSDICEEYSLLDSRVTVFHQDNSGVSAARNKGLAAAKGDFVTFIDADDLVHPNLLSILWDSLKSSCADFSMIHVIRMTNKEAKSALHTHIKDNIAFQCLTLNQYYNGMFHLGEDSFCVSVGKLFRKKNISNLQFFGVIGEDQHWLFRLLNVTNKVVLVNIPLYFWVQHSTSVTHQKKIKERIDFLNVLLDCYNQLPVSFCAARSWCLERLYRRIITTRFLAKGTSLEKDAEVEICHLYNLTKKDLICSQLFFATKCKLLTLYHFPYLYRAFMWLCDKRFFIFKSIRAFGRK